MASRPLKRQRKLTDLTINGRRPTLGAANGSPLSNTDTTQLNSEVPQKSQTTGNKHTNEAKHVYSKHAQAASRSTRGIPNFFNSGTSSQTSLTRSTLMPHQNDEILGVQNDEIEDELLSDVATTNSNKMSPLLYGFNSHQVFPRKNNAQAATRRHRESKKFANIPVFTNFGASTTTASAAKDDHYKGWADTFVPDNINELAVNPKKVATLSTWLSQATSVSNDHKALLVVKGPSGCGKSTAVRLIASTLGIRLLEWQNPTGTTFGCDGFVSLASQFEEFLNRSLQYSSLEIATGEDSLHSHVSHAPENTPARKEIILIEDIPNIFSRDSTALEAFRHSLLGFITAASIKHSYHKDGSRSIDQNVPVVLIFSDTPRTSGSLRSQILTIGRLLGQEILGHSSTSVVELNAVTSAAMTKALSLIVKKWVRRYKSPWTPPPSLLRTLYQSGDIRNAISNLELFRNDIEANDGTKDNQRYKTGLARQIGDPTLPRYTVESRENSVEFFHAVAKVMYNKRQASKQTSSKDDHQYSSQPPSYLSRYKRPAPSEVSSKQLFDNMDADAETFVAALHENYLPSCAGPDFTKTLDDCIDSLSTADILLPSSHSTVWSHRILNRSYTGLENVDALKQNELAFHAAVLGVLFVLPFPVNRGAAGMKSVRDPFKMVYPTLYRLSRQVEEVEEALTHYSCVIEATSLDYQLLSTDAADIQRSKVPAERSALSGPCSRIRRADMVLEYLPYLNILFPHSSKGHEASSIASLVKFPVSPILGVHNSELIYREVAPTSSGQRDQPATSRRISVPTPIDSSAADSLKTTRTLREQLILSDDDIDDGVII